MLERMVAGAECWRAEGNCARAHHAAAPPLAPRSLCPCLGVGILPKDLDMIGALRATPFKLITSGSRGRGLKY